MIPDESIKLAVGDVVKLQSGGLRMTITKIEAPVIETSWFDDGGNFFRDQFPEASLQEIECPSMKIRLPVKR